MDGVLIVKTGALGDVLRTTSILPGLRERHPGAGITWLTARGAVDLVGRHPLVAEVVAVDPKDPATVSAAAAELAARRWLRVISLDDERELCELASRVAARSPGALQGAHLDASGRPAYTADTAAWFDMGLLSVHGKARADQLKVANAHSQPRIYAGMLGIAMGEPQLPLPQASLEFARAFAERAGLDGAAPRIGLNTGAGGRWESKKLSVERTAALAAELDRRIGGQVAFLLLGGRDERARNDAILAAAGDRVRIVDAGTENSLLDFAALVDRLDLLVTSDSLALHVAIARKVPVVAFFAPTSAAEIELYGRGACVRSTAPDYASYRGDADTATLTVERLAEAVLRELARSGPGGRAARDGGPAR